MSNEGASAVTVLSLGRPGWFVQRGIGVSLTGGIYVLHGRRQVSQPHVRCKNIGGRGIPSAIIGRGSVRKVVHALVIAPNPAEVETRDWANEDGSVGHIGFAHQVNNALVLVGRCPVIIR